MKFQKLIYIFFLLTAICSCKKEMNDDFGVQGDRISFSLSNSSGSIGGNVPNESDNLVYKILFYKTDIVPSTSDNKNIGYENFYYAAEVAEWKTQADFNDYQFTIKNENLSKYTYMMVVIATTKDKHEIDFEKTDNDSDGKSLLTELKIKRVGETINGKSELIPLSKDNYISNYLITQEDIESGIIPLKLERIVGQMIFDIGRYDDEGNAKDLEKGYGSTLDRVYNISFTTKNFTESFFWFQNNQSTSSSQRTITENESVTPEICSYDTSKYFYDSGNYIMDSSKMPATVKGETGIIVNDQYTGTLTPEILNGTTRLYGPYEFSTQSGNLSINIKFDYYDTDFTEKIKKSIELKLPKESTSITVVPNYYTYIKIKIKENRIIDVPIEFGDFTLDNKWLDYE